MNSFRRYLPVFVSLAIIGFVIATPSPSSAQQADPATADPEKAPLPDKVSFKKHIAPFLKAKCAKCHTGDSAKAGVDLSAKSDLMAVNVDDAKLVVASHPEKSALVWVLEGSHDMPMMPPKAKKSVRTVNLFKKWITQGAKVDN